MISGDTGRKHREKPAALLFACIASAALISSIFVIASTIPVYAETHATEEPNPLLVRTDKQMYKNGDMIIVSGHLKSTIGKNPITIQVLNPNLNLVHIEQIDISNDGNFAFPVQAEGPLWIINGQYTIKAEYAASYISALTTFNFKGYDTPVNGSIKVRDPISDQTFEVNYTSTNVTIRDISINPKDMMLTVTTNSTDNGSLLLEIPRHLIDAKRSDGTDEKFLVFIDGDQVREVDDTSNVDFRIIKLNTYQGESKIEIIGTQVVPEFGYLAVPISAVLMAIAIVVTRTWGVIWRHKCLQVSSR